MESINMFILVFALVSMIFNVFIVFLLLRSNLKRGEEQLQIHKHMAQIGESLNVYVENQAMNSQKLEQAISFLAQEIDEKVDQQTLIIDENGRKNNVLLNNIKDRVEYLSTEVNIN